MSSPLSVSTDQLLLSKKNPPLKTENFPYFILDDFAPPEIFQKLMEEFPSIDEMDSTYAHGKKFINNRALTDSGKLDEFLSNKPTWRAVIDILGSQAFADDLSSMIRPHTLRHRLFGALRKWNMDGAKMPPLDRSVQLSYEWSGMPNGANVVPHTDKAAKLATFIWHFPTPDWKPDYHGHTWFMKPKQSKHDFNWANFKLPYDELDILDQSDVKANRLVMFAKTGNSWHAVPPIQCPDGVLRRVFIFNYRYPVEVANGFVARAFESFHRRSQGWLFRDFPEVNRKPKAP